MRRMNWSWVVGALGVGAIALAPARGDSRTSRDVKGSPVSFRLASTTPVSGYEKMDASGSTIYVAPRPIWSGGEVVSAQARDGGALEFTLNSDAAARVTNLAAGSGDRLAVFVDGKLTSVGALSSSGIRATVTGMSAPSTEQVLRLLNGVRPAPTPNPVSAMMTLVPGEPEGDLYTVDVFAQGITGLRSYQVGLVVEGGSSGELVREEVVIDKQRPDYIFADLAVIDAADQLGGRAAGILEDGIHDQVEPAYLATFTFRATPDASGTFQVRIETSEKSLLANNDNETMDFVAGAPAMITIGQGPRRVGDK